MQTEPLQPSERLAVVDSLRGFALLGILIVNLNGFVVFTLPEPLIAELTSTYPDKATDAFISILLDNKFITLFAMLFGFGFGLLIDRVAARGVNVNVFFLKRMFILFCLGLLNLAVWWGDILTLYASTGIFLLLFRRLSTKRILLFSLLFIFIIPSAIRYLQYRLLPPFDNRYLEDYVLAIQHGGITDMVWANLRIMNYIFLDRWVQWRDMAEVLGKFLLGYYILRMGWLQNLAAFLPVFRRALKWLMPLAIVVLAYESWLFYEKPVVEDHLLNTGSFLLHKAGVLVLSLSYACLLITLYAAGKGRQFFLLFRSVGMLSLTNYLTHTVCYVFIFYGMGLGLLGKLHLQWVPPIAFFIYILQVLFSRWWMSRYTYGPVEWVWRQLSYGKRFPIKKKAVVPAVDNVPV